MTKKEVFRVVANSAQEAWENVKVINSDKTDLQYDYTEVKSESVYDVHVTFTEVEIITATEFYEKVVKIQKRIINESIVKAMNEGNPIVKLPFNTFSAIDKEMEENGWVCSCFEDEDNQTYACFYTKHYNYGYEDEESSDKDELTAEEIDLKVLKGEFVPATAFYKICLKKQKEAVIKNIEEAIASGKQSVRLTVDTFPVLESELHEKSWEYRNWGKEDIPYRKAEFKIDYASL